MERQPANRVTASSSEQTFRGAERARRELLLGPDDFAPSRDDFEVIGAFNPGVAEVNGQIVLLVRVAERPRESRAGWVGLPRWTPASELAVDWVRAEEVRF